jgi:type IV pilus assembly protein PilF
MNMKSILVLVVCLTGAAACVTEGGFEPTPASDEEAAQANLNLGVGYLRQGRPDVAIDALQRALDLNPRLANAHSAIALAFDQLEDYDEAEDHYRRATQLDPSNADAQDIYAVFLCRQDRWQEAKSHFERAIAAPGYATPQRSMLNAATCARAADDLESAEAYFRSVLRINASNADALAGMVELSYQTENYLQGRAFLQRLFAAADPGPRELLICYMTERALADDDAAQDCANRLRSQYGGSQELGQLREMQRNGG